MNHAGVERPTPARAQGVPSATTGTALARTGTGCAGGAEDGLATMLRGNRVYAYRP